MHEGDAGLLPNLASTVIAGWEGNTAQIPSKVSKEEIESLENKIKVLEKQISHLTEKKETKFSTPVCTQKVSQENAPQKDIAAFADVVRPLETNLHITFSTPI